MVRNIALISAAVAIGAFAQGNNQSTSVVTLTLPSLGSQTLHGSVISTTSGATAYAIQCPSSVKSEDCMVPDLTVVEGPGTLALTLGLISDVAYVDCKVTSNVGTCTQTLSPLPSVTGSEKLDIETTVISDIGQYAAAVTITAGLEKLAQQTGSPTTITNRPTGDNTPTSNNTPTGNKTPEGSKTAATSTSSTGGVPKNTQQALLAGVAALAGGAMLL